MNVFPVLQRELLVAARRRATHRIRSISAMIAILVVMVVLPFTALISAPTSFGRGLFQFLSGYAMLLAALSGAFITANALAAERDDGTLGLLFLTDLSAADIVFGKFFATALNPLYALFAIFPALAIPMLFGGVMVEEFWRMAAALVATLFFSLALGLLISAASRSSKQVTAKTFSLLLFFFLAPLGLALLGTVPGVGPGLGNFLTHLGAASPVNAYRLAFTAGTRSMDPRFWETIGILVLSGTLFLGASAFALPRSWRRGEGAREAAERRFSAAGAARLAGNPIDWLVSRSGRTTARILYVLVIVGLALAIGGNLAGPASALGVHYGKAAVHWAIKLLIAVEAARFFREARRSGAWELLMCTPLRHSEIFGGLWRGWRRLFGPPILVLIFIELAAATVTFAFSFRYGFFELAAVNSALDLVAGSFLVGCLSVLFSVRLKKPEFAPALAFGMTLLAEVLFCVPNLLIYAIAIPVCRDLLKRDIRREIRRYHGA